MVLDRVNTLLLVRGVHQGRGEAVFGALLPAAQRRERLACQWILESTTVPRWQQLRLPSHAGLALAESGGQGGVRQI